MFAFFSIFEGVEEAKEGALMEGAGEVSGETERFPNWPEGAFTFPISQENFVVTSSNGFTAAIKR